MYDIHMHVIPGTDGGPARMEEALAMLSLARRQGVEAVMCVARFLEDSPEAARAGFEALERAARERRNIRGMKLRLGWEARFIKGSMTVTRNKYYGANMQKGYEVWHSEGRERYCTLVEFLPETDVLDFGYVLEPLCLSGRLLPVLLNAEQCLVHTAFSGHYWGSCDVRDFAGELHFSPNKRYGALFQINVQSLVDESDIGSQYMARWLVENKLADFAGTGANQLVCDDAWGIQLPGEDYYSVARRQQIDMGSELNPKVRQGIDYIREHCDAAYADALLSGNARMLLGMP